MLTPRLSFERWTELVSGTSEKWKPDHIKIAQVLQLVYWRFINIWREREKAVKNSRLKNVLLSNVSHEGKKCSINQSPNSFKLHH
jgi:light-regulated signal transduction histidine kinase (bacteriophytochrome)